MLQVQLQQHFRWILPCTKSSAGTRSLWLRCQVAVAILFQLHTAYNSVSTAYKSDSSLQKNVSKHGCGSAILHSWWKAAKAVSIQTQSSLSQWTSQRVRIGSTGPPLENCIVTFCWKDVISCDFYSVLDCSICKAMDRVICYPRSPA